MPSTLRTTWNVIRWSLLPSAAGGSGDRLCAFLADPAANVDADGRFLVVIPDCALLAAPFILFRLKRLGYSACRVSPSPDGLTVSGRR
jgi:hypothetical protein